MGSKKTKDPNKKINFKLILIVAGPILLFGCPIISSLLGYQMLNLTSRISASDGPIFYVVSVFVWLWWLGALLTITATPIGAILMLIEKIRQKKNK